MEVKQNIVKDQLDIIYRPHPILPAADCQYRAQEWRQGLTVRQILIANGIDQTQPISIIVDDRLLTVSEWDTVCPNPGQIINVKAEVQGGGGGGGGGSNVWQVVAMIALVVVAVLIQQYELVPAIMGMSAATASAVAAGVLLVAGGALISSVFAAQLPSTSLDNTSGTSSGYQTSPTYSISGGQNRQRQYESMPVLMGQHRMFFDMGSKPFTEYHGEDQYLYQIFHRGLSTSSFSDYQIGNNDLSNYQDWSWNYQDQYGKIESFPGNVDSAQGTALEAASGWVIRTTSNNTYRIGLDLEATMYYANNAGGLDTTSVQLRVQYREVGSSTWVDPSVITVTGTGFVSGQYESYQQWVASGYNDWVWTEGEEGWNQSYTWIDTSHYETRTRYVTGSGNIVIVSGNTQAPRRATLFIDVPTGQYEVRIIRDTPDSTDARLANKTNWSTIRSYQTDSGNYYGQDRVGLTIRASEQLNGIVQQLSAYGSAKANYWNGSAFVFGETNNPAHWYMDFALGRKNQQGKLMYGIGLSQSQIDFDGLHLWAQFCDTEGLTFNAVLDGSQTAADILSAISRCGFGSPTWASGKLGVVWDQRNASAVAAFGMSNIIKGSFTVTYITENLAEEIIVRYINPNKDWQQDEVRVNVPNIDNPLRSSTVDLFGCTSQTMAGKFANYLAAQQYYRRRRITWDCDFEGFVCNRGDVVLLSHDLTQWGYSGRIVSFSGNSLVLDRQVPINGATNYLMLKRPDGTMTTYTVQAEIGSDSEITLTTIPDFQEGYEPMDHIWFFSPLATPGKKVKILSVQPVSESRVQIVATDEYDEFYDAWDGDFNVPQSSTLLLSNVPVVSNIRVNENLYRGVDGAIKSHVTITWDTNGVWERASVKYQVGNDAPVRLSTNATNIEFDTYTTGSISIDILPIFGINIGSPATYTGTIAGLNAPVPDVEELVDFYRDGKTVLRWNIVNDPRAIDYEVRKGTTWDKAQVLGRVLGNEFTTDGDGTYWVAAHANNNYSSNPTLIIIEGAAIVDNVVATYDEEATGWSGTLGGGAIIDGTNIILDGTPIPSEGSYEIPGSHIIDVGTSQACSVSVTYRMMADSPFNLVSLIPVFSEISSLVGKYAGQADVKIQIAIAPDSGVFGAWRDFVPGTYVGRKFKIRALLYSYNDQVTPVLDKLVFTVDMPDRYETGTNISATAGGISVTYDTPFQITPNVQVTIIGAVANDDIVLSNETENGFDVKIINGATNVTRNINWIAQGY